MHSSISPFIKVNRCARISFLDILCLFSCENAPQIAAIFVSLPFGDGEVVHGGLVKELLHAAAAGNKVQAVKKIQIMSRKMLKVSIDLSSLHVCYCA